MKREKREKIITEEIYHIYNRGVEKRDVFMSDQDYVRFIHDLFEFNDINPTHNLNYYFEQSMEVGLPKIGRGKRKLFVELMAFCLMPNHYHLIARQKRDGGITEFMRKLGTGYTNYFNQKYERVGPLFQGKYKYVRLNSEKHFIYLPYYVHLNPLGLKFNRQQKNTGEIMRFLKNYKWSSFPDYVGIKNFPSVTQREFLNKILGKPEQHKKDIIKWLMDSDIEDIKELTLE